MNDLDLEIVIVQEFVLPLETAVLLQKVEQGLVGLSPGRVGVPHRVVP